MKKAVRSIIVFLITAALCVALAIYVYPMHLQSLVEGAQTETIETAAPESAETETEPAEAETEPTEAETEPAETETEPTETETEPTEAEASESAGSDAADETTAA